MENSVISKQQLEILLSSMKDSVPKKKVLEALQRTHQLNTLEKNAFYHNMLEMAKNSQSPRDIAISVLEAVEQVLGEKAEAVASSVDAMDNDNPTTSGGLFRRVG